MPTTDLPTTNLPTLLRDTVRGRVLTTADGEDYHGARHVYSGTADLHPVAVVQVADTADVQAAVSIAAETGTEVAVRGGGHSAAGHGSVDGGIVLDLSALRDVRIDPAGRVGTAGGGITAGEYVAVAGGHGLTTGFGDGAAVGVGGITVGGGIGLLSRRYGMTIDALLAAEIVTADGGVLRVDAEHHPDLFWAIRGGGSNFGVLTSMDFRLYDVAAVTGGLLALPATPQVLSGFVTEALAAPPEVSTIVTVMPCPPVPFVDARQHGRPVLFAQLVHTGAGAQAERALQPFRSLATPLADQIRTTPYPQLMEQQPPKATAITRTQFLDTVDPAAAGAMIDAIADCPAPMRILQLRPLGGAVADVPNDATAYGFRDRPIATYLGGFYRGEPNRAATVAWADTLTATLDQGLPGAYLNFVGEPGQHTARDCYPAATWDRLVRIKQRHDPGNLFRRNHNIPPAG